jgi:hypothetical protein
LGVGKDGRTRLGDGAPRSKLGREAMEGGGKRRGRRGKSGEDFVLNGMVIALVAK